MFRVAQTALAPTTTFMTTHVEGPSEPAPFDESDIGPILSILSKCPEEGLLTRVFSQHSFFGTCWYDSSFMMIFESSAGKKLFLPLFEECFKILLKHGINDLSYKQIVKKTDENIKKQKEGEEWYAKMFGKEVEEVSTTYESESSKTELLAKELKELTGSNADIGVWEILSASILKYLLLGYLFHREPPKPNAKILSERRKSWNASSFNSIHKCMRTYSGMFIRGAENEQGKRFMKELSKLIEELSKGKCSIVDWDTNKLEETEGYYLIVSIGNGGHVVSMYKCNGRWNLFNNDYGNIPLSDEDSEQVSKIGIEGLQIFTDTKEKILSHVLLLKDNTKIGITVSHPEITSDTNFTIFVKDSSFVFVSKKETEGGRKKRKSKTKKARKQKRKTYKK